MTTLFKLVRKFKNFTDAFGNQVSRGTVNRLDLPADKSFSEERFRLFQDGERVNINYGEGADVLEDLPDVYQVTCPENTEMIFRTAQKQRYVVGFEAEWSNSFEMNRSLQGSEYVEVMLTADNSFSNGHGIRFESDKVLMFERRDGVNVAEKELSPDTSLKDFKRLEHRYNWYNVGNYKAKETFTVNGEQFNKELNRISVDGGRGSKTSLGYVATRFYREPGTEPLILDHGSLGFNILGDVTATTRGKAAVLRGLEYTSSPDYEPLFALRIDPKNSNVTAELDMVQNLEGPQGEVVAIAVDPELTDANGWETPNENTALNNAVQFTENVSTFPDNNGDEVTSTGNPGGFQVGLATTEIQGQGGNERRTGTARVRKRPLFSDDVVVVLARADENDDFSVRFDTEQEW